jgi:hypothetical protein
MTKTLREILERRKRDNAASPMFGSLGGDGGFVFPSITRDRPFRVIPIAEAKEYEVDDQSGKRSPSSVLLGVHASRRTFNSIAIEVGIPQEAREALLNHAGKGVNVRAYGRPQSWDYLRTCAEQVEAALWSRIRGEHRKGRGKLRAVK